MNWEYDYIRNIICLKKNIQKIYNSWIERIIFQWDTSIYIALVLQEWLHEVGEQQDEPLHQRRLEESTSQVCIVWEVYVLLISRSRSSLGS